MRMTTKTLLMGAALIAVAGCSKKPPKELPPPPATSTDTGTSTMPTDSGTGGPTAGSRADFIAQSGTDTIHFGTDLYDVDGESQAILSRQAVWLKRYPAVSVTIEGHADERGTREYNIALGARRATNVKNYLVSLGISPARIRTISYGKERPVAVCNDISCWSQNRRAVTVLDNAM